MDDRNEAGSSREFVIGVDRKLAADLEKFLEECGKDPELKFTHLGMSANNRGKPFLHIEYSETDD